MSEPEDEGLDPLETEPALGDGGLADDSLDGIQTELEQRIDGPDGQEKR